MSATGGPERLPRLVLVPEARQRSAGTPTRWWGKVAERVTRAVLEVGPPFLAEVAGGTLRAVHREGNAEKRRSGGR